MCSSIKPSGKVWVWIVVILVLLPVIGVTLFHLKTGSAIKKRLADLRAQGHPVTLKELNDAYVLPAGADNAADLYMDAFGLLMESSDEDKQRLPLAGRASLPGRSEPLPDANQVVIRQYLSDNQETLAALYEAASFEHARYPIDLTQGMDASMAWLSDVRKCTFLLKLEALMHLEHGDPDRAIESVRAGLALAKSMKAPMLIHYLVRVSVISLHLDTVERILCRGPLADEPLQAMIHTLDALSTSASMKDALVGERCMGLSTFDMSLDELAKQVSPNSRMPILLLAPARVLGVLKRDQLAYLDIMQDIFNALDIPMQNRYQAVRAIAQDVEQGQRGGFMSRMIAPALGRVVQLDIRGQAGLIVTRTALQVERFRLARGRLPESLEQLVPHYFPAVPSDPFDGQPLRYLPLAKGFVVYSIGEDLSDDGGAEQVKRKRGPGQKTPPYDKTFIVER